MCGGTGRNGDERRIKPPHPEGSLGLVVNHLVVLLPVLNEALGLRWVLERLPTDELVARNYRTSVLVVDGHSTDGSMSVADEHGVQVLVQTEAGKGSAIRQGFERALAMNADVVVMLDADGTYAPGDMIRLVDRLEQWDVVIGDRLGGRIDDGAMTRLNFVGNHLLTWTATALYGHTTLDLCSGYWAMTASAITRMKLNSVSFELEAEMYASMVHHRVSFGYVPIRYSVRLGEAKLGSTADGWEILRKLITRKVFPTPAR